MVGMAFEDLESISSSACQSKSDLPWVSLQYSGDKGPILPFTQEGSCDHYIGKSHVRFSGVPKIDEVPFCTLFCWLCCLCSS